jgi:hypothetical protein
MKLFLGKATENNFIIHVKLYLLFIQAKIIRMINFNADHLCNSFISAEVWIWEQIQLRFMHFFYPRFVKFYFKPIY